LAAAGCGLRFIDVAILWYSVKIMNCYFASLFIILLLLGGCRAEEEVPPPPLAPAPVPPAVMASDKIGCQGCHGEVKPDPFHNLACTACHGGHDHEGQADRAHVGLIAKPAHPATMAAACGNCHPDQVRQSTHSLHFTLSKEINAIRTHFGAEDKRAALTDIPEAATIATPLDLVDDLLRRRCLRCHVYTSGDPYTAVTRGTGCSACHLSFKEGKLQAHTFIAPTDQQCLSCHYGNYVGNDYYGRYEHDFNWEYRTPYTVKIPQTRPFGVESHSLVADIHQQRGLGCRDCHQGSGHNQRPGLSCASCHGWRPGQPSPPLRNLQVQGDRLILTLTGSGRRSPVPPLRHPAHRQYQHQVACQVCHGQWSFNDSTTHLLLSKVEDYEPWERLTVQSSAEVEAFLEHNLNSGEQERPPTMRDGISGESRPGVWYMGYGQRRWEEMLVARDSDGIIKVFRPVLDLRLSLVEADGQVRFDNLTGGDSGLRPYTPHTTGPAGLFYRDRFRHLLPPEQK